jgi:hypothetical protein
MGITNNTPGLQPTHTSIQWEPEALLPEVKRLGLEAWSLPSFCAKIKDE